MKTEEKIEKLLEFKKNLIAYDERHSDQTRTWLNQNVNWVRREVIEADCFKAVTITPPPVIGGLIMRNVDPFNCMFEKPYRRSLNPVIYDMIDECVGALRNPLPVLPNQEPIVSTEIQSNYAFIAMPMDKNDHQLVDVLEAIKEAAQKCGILAERVDEKESNDRITDRIIESIQKAAFVIVDLTKERPNVFFEAGYAHGLGKIPIYVAREGTIIHFDLKDYPVIFFRNMKELKDGVFKRLIGLTSNKKAS